MPGIGNKLTMKPKRLKDAEIASQLTQLNTTEPEPEPLPPHENSLLLELPHEDSITETYSDRYNNFRDII